MNYTVKYMLYLIGCSARGVTPEIPSETLDFELLFKLSKEHQSENLVYVSLERLGLDVPEDIMRKFRQCTEKAIVREARQELELREICGAFAAEGIRHIPLKGSVMKYMYPSPDLRQNGDMDILADVRDEDKIKSIMASAGYENTSVAEKDLSFYKGKIHIELHRHLLYPQNPRYEFFERVWDTAKSVDGFTYEMTAEMMYVFLMTHLASHLAHGGAGIKLITDFYVFNKPLDSLILNGYLRETKLDKLDSIVRRLTDYWFNMRSDADDSVKFLSEYILKNGVYGSSVTSVQMEFADKMPLLQKLKHYFKMTFRPYNTMKYLYPVLRKAPVLLPFCYVHRIIKKLTWDIDRTKTIITGSKESADTDVLREFKKIL